MKNLVTAAILVFATSWATAASAQVYGTNDDPYQANPFASNMTVPDAPAAAAPAPATPTSTTSVPAPAPPQPDTGKARQTAASTTDPQPAAKKQTPP